MTPRTCYAVVRPDGYVPSNGFGVTPVFVERERAEALSGHDARHVQPVHIIPAADHARLTRIADAARTLLEGKPEEPGKSECPYCGDGRSAVSWRSDMARLREAVESE